MTRSTERAIAILSTYNCLVLLILCTFCCNAQRLPPVLQNSDLQRGIYMSFDEFLRNDPSIRDNFELSSKSSEKKLENGVADYKLILYDSIKTNIKRRDIWGASDGRYIYINEFSHSGIHNFKRIHKLGRYCYFRGSIPSDQSPALSGGLLAVAAIELHGDWSYVLNINNGKVFSLDKGLMRLILKKDHDLLTRYEQEEKMNSAETMFSYLDRYNEKYWIEASPDYLEPIEVILYRTGKKENGDSFRIVINDTLICEMTQNSFYTFKNGSETVKLCGEADCVDIDLIKKRINYIQCSWKGEGVPTLQKVNNKEGEFYSRMAKVLSERDTDDP